MGDRTARPELGDPVSRHAPVGEDVVGVLAGVGRRRAHLARVRLKRGAGPGCTMPATSTNVPRCWLCGCSGASVSDSTGEADVGALHDLAPLVAGLLLEDRASRSLSAGHCAVVLPRQILTVEARVLPASA